MTKEPMTNLAVDDKLRAEFAAALAQVNTSEISDVQIVEAFNLPPTEHGQNSMYRVKGTYRGHEITAEVWVGSRLDQAGVKDDAALEREALIHRMFVERLAYSGVSAIGNKVGVIDILDEYDEEDERPDNAHLLIGVQPAPTGSPAFIRASIGRRLWYWPPKNSESSGFIYEDPTQPLDAGIAYVHSDRLINISVSDQVGVSHSRTYVPLCQEGDQRPEMGGYCEWMPYQQGQARKGA